MNKKTKTITLRKIPVVKSKNRTGFVGFLLGIQGIKQIYATHIESKALQFLLTFKLSQDNLKTIFSLVRGSGGSNDNPNCVQFKRAMKGILMHNELKVTVHGNCISDNTAMGSISKSCTTAPKKIDEVVLYVDENDDIDEDDDADTVASLTDYVDDVVTYVAGFVERKMMSKLNCANCQTTIRNGQTIYGELVNLKTRGGLIHPNVNTFNICKRAEMELRAADLKKENFYQPLFDIILRKVKNCFQDCCSVDHANLVIRNVIKVFLDLRLHHVAKLQNQQRTKKIVRRLNTHNTHLHHQ